MNTGMADAYDLCIYQSDAKPAPKFSLLVRAPNNDKAWREFMVWLSHSNRRVSFGSFARSILSPRKARRAA